jgi:uncharacterized protein
MSENGRIDRFLFNHLGQVKWQWRVLVFFLLSVLLSKFIIAFYEVFIPAKPVTATGHDPVTLIHFAGWLIMIGLLTWILLRFLDKRPWRSIGLSFHAEWKREFTFGALLGALMPVILLILLLPWGFISVSVQPVELLPFVTSLALNILIWLTAAVWMELLLRGYFFQTMAEGMGKIVATIFVSLMYALIQTQFHTDELIQAVNLAALGFVFSICYFRTRALWTGIGMHFALNFMQNFVFGTPVHSTRSFYSLFEVDIALRNIAVGDYFGMEQGLVASLLILSCIYYLFQSKQLVISETVRKIKFDALSTPFSKPKK